VEAYVHEGNPGQAAALLQALSQPGPGILSHPWLGELYVSQSAPWRRSYSYQNLGLTVFTLTFVEDAAPDAPAMSPNLPGLADSLAAQCGLLADLDLDRLCQLTALGDEVLKATLGTVQWVASTVNDVLQGNFTQIALLAGDLLGLDGAGLLSLAGRAGSLSAAINGLFNVISSDNDILGQAKALDSSQCAAFMAFGRTPLTSLPAKAGLVRAQAIINDQALQTWLGRRGVIEAARSCAHLIPEYQEQAAILRASLVAGVDDLLAGTHLPPAPDALASGLQDLLAHSLAALALAGGQAPHLRRAHELLTRPSLVLAWRYGGRDKIRPLLEAESDIISRNRISHPGFCPPGEIEVLL
jgi:prophage DNA circulation protein